MRINVFDPNSLDLLGVVSNYESVQWSPTFNTPDGTFQIDCSMDYIDLLKNDYLVENTAELEHIGVIKKVETIKTLEREKLQVTGVMLEKDILYKRVIKAFIMYVDVHPISVVEDLLEMCLVNPAEPSRKFPNIGEVITPKISDFPDSIENVTYTSSYANLGDEIYTLIQSIDAGVKAKINRTTLKIDLEFYVGSDKSYGTDDMIVFAQEMGTAVDVTYQVDSSQNFNTITVIGEDKLTLQAARDNIENELLIEKSIDVSSEVPWTTYLVEKPDEDGGQYYRYKKYTPPEGFITNRDVWEKYNVERIETQQTCYREVEVTEKVEVDINDYIEQNDIEEVSTYYIDTKGTVLNTPVNARAKVAATIKNSKANTKTKIGSFSKTKKTNKKG